MVLAYLALLNAAFGAVIFEWAWHKGRRIREVDEKRDGLFPAFRRNDTQRWSKLKLYLGAVTILPLRVLAFLTLTIIVYPVVRIIFLGIDVT